MRFRFAGIFESHAHGGRASYGSVGKETAHPPVFCALRGMIRKSHGRIAFLCAALQGMRRQKRTL
jgi:hypothetical protein